MPLTCSTVKTLEQVGASRRQVASLVMRAMLAASSAMRARAASSPPTHHMARPTLRLNDRSGARSASRRACRRLEDTRTSPTALASSQMTSGLRKLPSSLRVSSRPSMRSRRRASKAVGTSTWFTSPVMNRRPGAPAVARGAASPPGAPGASPPAAGPSSHRRWSSSICTSVRSWTSSATTRSKRLASPASARVHRSATSFLEASPVEATQRRYARASACAAARSLSSPRLLRSSGTAR